MVWYYNAKSKVIMLGSRKRTCRRSKSRCGGTRQAIFAGRGGGSSRGGLNTGEVFIHRVGGSRGVSGWQTVGGSRRGRSKSRCGGTQQSTGEMPSLFGGSRGVRGSRRGGRGFVPWNPAGGSRRDGPIFAAWQTAGGSRGREFPDQMFLAPNGGGRGRDMMDPLASSGGSRGGDLGVGLWARERDAGMLGGGSRGGELWAHEHGTGLGDMGVDGAMELGVT